MRSEYSCHFDCSRDAESKALPPSRFGVIASLLLFCLVVVVPGYGAGYADDSSGPSGGSGREIGGTIVRQSVEFGGNIVNLTGSDAMYRTLVNEQDGPRLLQQSLSIEALPNTRSVFDSIYLNSFGWGGEPNNAMRLRIDKRGVYRFNFSFRRDKNYFDYNLLANPLNDAGPIVNFSPHALALTRRMYDVDLLILPQHRLSFILGWSRSRNEGPSYSSVHANRVDALLDQWFNTTWDDYRMGVNWRIVPKTTVTFLESLQFVKNDTSQTLDPTNPYLVTPTGGRYLTTYDQTQAFSVYIPTEQVNLTSYSIRNLEITAHFAYGNADGDTPLSQSYTGSSSQDTNGTTARTTWVTNTADFGATYHVNPHLRLVDSFRFHAYRIPGVLNLLGTVPAENVLYFRRSKQQVTSNEITLHYDFSRKLGVRAGYLYRHISDDHAYYECDGLVGTPDAVNTCIADPAGLDEMESLTINQNTAIGGVWYRPGRELQVNGEVRVSTSDDFLTRIDPLREVVVRGNVSYRPQGWLTMGANANIREQRNNAQGFGYNAHWRSFGFNMIASPNSRISFETVYEYLNLTQDGNVCFAYGATDPNTVLPGTFTQPCTNDTTGSTSLWQGLGYYNTQTNFGSASVIIKPVRRVTASVGYNVTSVDGSELILNPNQPLGPLSYIYQRPSAMLAVQICKPVELRGGWNYYEYSENGGIGPPGGVTAGRYFHANVTTLSARYSF